VTQTTLSMDDTSCVIDAAHASRLLVAAQGRYLHATQNRQDAVKQLADECDVVLVVGSPNSSNSNRLRELAERMATPAYLIDGAKTCSAAGSTASSVSASRLALRPEVLVRGVIQQLHAWGATGADELAGREENITFSMPKELRVRSLPECQVPE
jgi:4-hydroxy-3-methylbut-2-enyl diphosphate reductase